MGIIVVKFGGTSMADATRIRQAAAKIVAEQERGHQVVAVVSAMAGVTNQLIAHCREFADDPRGEAYDSVLASGEQVAAGLLALCLTQMNARSEGLQAWQVPILSDESHSTARITDIATGRLKALLDEGIVPVLCGFQGVTSAGRLTTLGRGGSDTTAVAVAAALKAERCDIYTDVDGVYTSDPRFVTGARKLKYISYEEMLEMASLGAKVLHPRSVGLAMQYGVAVQVLSSFDPAIGSDLPGTLVVSEEANMEKSNISGVTISRDEGKISLLQVPDQPGVAAAIFDAIAEADINVDMIVQNIAADGKSTDITFTCARADVAKAAERLNNTALLKGTKIQTSTNVVKVSLIGTGIRNHPGVARTMFKALAEKNINIQVIATSEVRISVIIDEDYGELALRVLHNAYKLEKLTENG